MDNSQKQNILRRIEPDNWLPIVARVILDVIFAGWILLTIAHYLPLNIISYTEWFCGNQTFRLILLPIVLVWLLHYLASHYWKRAIAAVVIVLILSLEVLIYIPFSGEIVENPINDGISRCNRVRVMVFNTQMSDHDLWLEYFRYDNVDVACLTELSVKKLELLQLECGRRSLNMRNIPLFDGSEVSNAIVTAGTFISVDTLAINSKYNPQRRGIIAEVEIRGFRSYIAVVHYEPLREVSERGDRISFVNSWRVRRTQSEDVARTLSTFEGPVILAGDLNATPTDRCIVPLRRSLNDSWQDAGKGLGGTWEGYLPFFRIDYIFYKGFEKAANTKTVRFENSDHRAYRVDIVPLTSKH